MHAPSFFHGEHTMPVGKACGSHMTSHDARTFLASIEIFLQRSAGHLKVHGMPFQLAQQDILWMLKNAVPVFGRMRRLFFQDEDEASLERFYEAMRQLSFVINQNSTLAHSGEYDYLHQQIVQLRERIKLELKNIRLIAQ